MRKWNVIAMTALLGSAAFCLTSCDTKSSKSVHPNLGQSVSVDCSGFSFTTEIDAFWTDKTCGYQDAEGVLHISPETMKLFKPDEFKSDFGPRQPKGLRCFPFRMSDADGKVDFGYLAADGRARISDDPHDNGCQFFRNDVAISYVDGKAIFFDKDLKVVEATEYELADPFYKNLAKVCTVRPQKVFYGDHSFDFEWVGGTCGYIDIEFNVVVPIATPYESTARLTGGKYDGVELDQSGERVLEFLVDALKDNTSPVEAVFGPSGCKLESCLEEKKRVLGISPDLDETKWWLTSLHFRLEDQSLWEGHVLSNRQWDLTLHSLKRIEILPISPAP